MVSEYIDLETLDIFLGRLMPQNRLICEVALCTGLRISDVLALLPDAIASEMVVTERKTGKQRTVYLPDGLVRRVASQMGRKWAFAGRDQDKHKSRQAVWADCKRVCREMGLDARVTPHSMRKIYAVMLMRSAGDIEEVREELRHKYVTTTMVYALADVLRRRNNGSTRRR